MNAYAAKIVVDRERMTNLTASGDVYNLFDEQALANDPKAGSSGAPVTQYTNGYINASLYYPIESVVDLGVEYQLTDLYYYDINGADLFQAWCGDGKIWTEIVNQNTTAYMTWVAKATTCKGRFVRFKMKSPSAAVTEVVLYGSSTSNPEALPTPTTHTKPTLGELMGTNGFIDDDRNLLQVVGNVREYHSWMWDDGNTDAKTPAYPNNVFGFSPSWVRGTGWGWDFDEYYADLDGRGVKMEPVLQGAPAWMFGKATGDSLKPMALGADSTKPESFKAHADYVFQFAARYGSATVPSADLRVDTKNTAKSALDVIHSLETWNEPDKNWKGVTGYFSPQVLHAMLSADYDGNKGAMGTKVGVKNADPNLKFVAPGLISFNLEYVKAMKYFADLERGGSFPADVLNFHHYCTDAGGQGGGQATTGISPEEDDLRGRMEAVVAYRDKYLPGKELWLSEFGWDTHPQSVYGAKNIGGHDEYEIQGRWLVRGFLEVAASGFDKAQQFMLRDTWDNSPGIFATSGLVHDKYDTLSPKYEKKVSWYYVNTLHKTMKNYRFEKDESTNGLRIYKFSNAVNADSVAYVLWNPDDATADQEFKLTWPTRDAKVIRLKNGQALGESASISASSGKINLASINGSPALVFGIKSGTTRIQAEKHVSANVALRKVNVKGASSLGSNTPIYFHAAQ